MWILTIIYPGQPPRIRELAAGTTTIGRQMDSDVVLSDTSVSRAHAAIDLDPETDCVQIRDLGSLNGTLVNGNLLAANEVRTLSSHDLVRIGVHQIGVACERELPDPVVPPVAPERPDTAQLVPLPDRRADLMYETARHLNTVLDIDTALEKISTLMKRAMGADRCAVVRAGQYGQLNELGFSETIARLAHKARAPIVVPNGSYQSADDVSESAGRLLIYSALCVPVIVGERVPALIYLCKTDSAKSPFDEGDVQSAEAISHMVSLTLERLDLFERVRQEQRLRQLLQRHLPPERVEYLLQNYMRTGRLPGLDEVHATVLFADIANSTGLAERLGARRFGEMLARYYQDVSMLVLQNGGLLDKYLGDGIMATFGTNPNDLEPELRAVRTGLAMIDLVQSNYREVENPIQIGIGVNSGPVVAGYVSTKERIEFAVLGDTVNVAFRLQGLARPNRLFIGCSTHDAVGANFDTCSIGSVTVRGRHEPIETYEVLAPACGEVRGRPADPSPRRSKTVNLSLS